MDYNNFREALNFVSRATEKLVEAVNNLPDHLAILYVLAAAGFGVLYSMYQLLFALYHAVKGKRLIKGQLLPMLDFYGDKVIAFILASGVGVGFGVSIELKNLTDESIKNLADESIDRKLAIELLKEFRDKMDKFYNGGIIASGILLAGFTTMAILTILSSAKCTGRSF
ncbi:CASP-like protein 4D2 [Lycium barbarum]|uniref:CASP-like protein 4D2 n=1 Tax=Lycium barbarum TaxID=112863 RepID=UPI00293ED827|nr:CASP-like protein 4D2 [Lycium barbarum]